MAGAGYRRRGPPRRRGGEAVELGRACPEARPRCLPTSIHTGSLGIDGGCASCCTTGAAHQTCTRTRHDVRSNWCCAELKTLHLLHKGSRLPSTSNAATHRRLQQQQQWHGVLCESPTAHVRAGGSATAGLYDKGGCHAAARDQEPPVAPALPCHTR